jgi:hypothetical protein
MTRHSTHLSALCPYRNCTVHTADGSSLSVAGQGTFCSDSFNVPDVSLVPDLTMQLMSAGQITDHDYRVILDSDFCYIQDHRTGHLVGTGPRRRDSQRLWELDWLCLPSAAPASLASHCFVHVVILSVASSSGPYLWILIICFASSRSSRVCFRSGVFRSLSGLSIGKADSASLSL